MQVQLTGTFDEFRILFANVTDNAIAAKLDVISQSIAVLGIQQERLMATEQQILDQLNVATTQIDGLTTTLDKIGTESSATLAALAQAKADLAALVAAAGGTSAAVDAALQTLAASIGKATGSATNVDNLVPDAAPPAP